MIFFSTPSRGQQVTPLGSVQTSSVLVVLIHLSHFLYYFHFLILLPKKHFTFLYVNGWNFCAGT